MSNLFALFKIIWMSPEWNVPRSLVTWWLKRKFAVDNGRRSIRMEEQINQSFAIGMNGNLKLNSSLLPLFSHIMICIFSHLNVWLVGIVLGHLFCLVWHICDMSCSHVLSLRAGNKTVGYNQSSNLLCSVAVQKICCLIWHFGPTRGSFAIPILFSSNRPKLSDTEILTFWQSQYFVGAIFSAADLVGGSSELWEGARCLVM